MGLKIKKGVKITAYGPGCEAFTDQSDLSQAILEHLKIRFPDEIEDDEPGDGAKDKKATK